MPTASEYWQLKHTVQANRKEASSPNRRDYICGEYCVSGCMCVPTAHRPLPMRSTAALSVIGNGFQSSSDGINSFRWMYEYVEMYGSSSPSSISFSFSSAPRNRTRHDVPCRTPAATQLTKIFIQCVNAAECVYSERMMRFCLQDKNWVTQTWRFTCRFYGAIILLPYTESMRCY